jgi:hypothetical protein
MELPFKLKQNHKWITKGSWKKRGLIVTDEEFEEIYNKYIVATHCELCDKKFPNTQDRQMDHNHTTGEFRNIVCQRCNFLKVDRNQSNNPSGYIGIHKHYSSKCKQGFTWNFQVYVDGKQKTIKSCVDKEKLIKFADKWKIDNKYNS